MTNLKGISFFIILLFQSVTDLAESKVKYNSLGDRGQSPVSYTHLENDATLELLSKTALSHVEAGADMVAPSDMMDGRVRAIRQCLDKNGHKETPIMSYAVRCV